MTTPITCEKAQITPERISAHPAVTTLFRILLLALTAGALFAVLTLRIPPRGASPYFMGLPTLCVAGLAFSSMPHDVALLDSCLVIRGLFSEIHVPLAQVERVSRAFTWGPEITILELRSRSRFGRRIRFIPRGGPWLTGTKSSVPDRLRDLVEAASNARCTHDAQL